jgi:acetolactate synthase-1/2/3 large subunit
MTGAENLVQALLDAGIEVCFTNPGTSEMHFLAAINTIKKMRPILTLFEGVATGAADGYARMADKPACTLLHLGPGLGNGLANLHNAGKARSPMVNIVGDHATFHKSNETPLNSDVEGIARPISHWGRTSYHPDVIAWDGAEAVAEAMKAPGRIATLILPADVSWGESKSQPPKIPLIHRTPRVPQETIREIASVLSSGEPAFILMSGKALREKGLQAAARISTATKALLYCDTFVSRLQRGAGEAKINRLPYFAEQSSKRFEGIKHLILVESVRPESFFAYPNKPTRLIPKDCQLHTLAGTEEDSIQALCDLADELGLSNQGYPQYDPYRPELPTGQLNPLSAAATIGALMPENAIVCDESGTSGGGLMKLTRGAPKHDWLNLTGGSIGLGLPLAVGAAVACPDRKVICLSGDGGAMYTIQSLWTQAREKLDVVNVIFSNRSYAILELEAQRVGIDAARNFIGPLFQLDNPKLDFCGLAGSMGVKSYRASSAQEFNDHFANAVNTKGPILIEVVL